MNVAPIAALVGLIATAALIQPWIIILFWVYLAYLVWSGA